MCHHIHKKKGYVLIQLTELESRKDKRRPLHRLVAMAFIPNPDTLPQVNHLDGDKRNNCVSNLQWCTNFKNYKHAVANGLFVKMKTGGDSPHAHLTNAQAREIREVKLSQNGFGPGSEISRKYLAKKYGVTIGVIKGIRTGKSYPNA